jgi:uncharacterized protein (DUF2141 family)
VLGEQIVTPTFTLRLRACQAWLWLLLCLGLAVAPFSAQTWATLEVSVSGIEGAGGHVGIAVWDSGVGFPEDVEQALDLTYVAIENGTARTDFERLAPGTYAVTVFHDENDNQRFDKNWIGIPREAWGVSNHVRPRLRAPRFDEARFDIAGGGHAVEIQIE